MKLPILAYGHSILKQKCISIEQNTPEVQQLINNMWETMENANGCGLSASQVNQPLKIFIADSTTTYENLEAEDREIFFEPDDQGVRETFINAKIINYSNETWEDSEGCLSIPGISQKIKRPWEITIEYLDKNFGKQVKTFTGLTARIIQHEYDHTNGVLYLDYLKPLSRKLMESKLKKIAKGNINTKYPMKFIRM